MKKIFNVLKNSKNIFEGIKNSIIRNEFVETVHSKRMEICKTCEHFDTVGTNCAAPGTQPCCSACGCSLPWKTRSLGSQCGDDDNVRWFAVITPEQEEKLNEKFGEPKY